MESPPSSSTWSEGFILSDDSGLLLTNESASTGSVNSRNGRKCLHFEDSDCEEKSLSQDDSLDGMSDIMCGENFNTLKKGPNWTDFATKQSSPIEPPPEFQDKPQKHSMLDYFCDKLAQQIIRKALHEYKEVEHRKIKVLCHLQLQKPPQYLLHRPCFPSEFIPFSPCHIGRPSSRSSLGSSRLSSSHNSLAVPNAQKVDDSTFITQAVSHDTLSCNQISDLYNVPFDSDIYAVPVDTVKPQLKQKRSQHVKKKRRNTAGGYRDVELRQYHMLGNRNTLQFRRAFCFQNDSKRHSVAGSSTQGEPIHVTLQEVRQYLQTLYSSSSDSSISREAPPKAKIITNNNRYSVNKNLVHCNEQEPVTVAPGRSKKSTLFINIKNKKVKDSCDHHTGKQINLSNRKDEKRRKSPTKVFSLKQMLCNMFRFKKLFTPDEVKEDNRKIYNGKSNVMSEDVLHSTTSISSRALPPLPPCKEEQEAENRDHKMLDFATSIQRVKDYGWYWGPISCQAAEKILSNEPDGSFIVRDSSDDHYIFSLTFKLNNSVRHVRIEHDQGNFSFGSCTKFKSQTIVEFIENAVEHSRSGRYLFFLHRRPVIGPVRVQLLHPVSRFKQVQSLQHMCRFVIHKNVRRDLISSLPLPRRMIDYLNTPYYYTELLVDVRSSEEEKFSDNNGTVGSLGSEHNVQLVDNHPVVPVNNYVVVNNENAQQP
ncbi:unnamed protein product [Phyllotreta striolata]|uniref:Suppressor of cytokine signaling 7 n=1 Tax=Phyllotreta striolata TaxID=444603 RepID=A0A9N9TA52_PHYSR|nr:unnamed protein product [Phyllotreta striolata]